MKRAITSSMLPLAMSIALWACSSSDTVVAPDNKVEPLLTVTCLDCHSSETALKTALGTMPAPAVAAAITDDG